MGFVRVSPCSKRLPGGLVVVVAARRDPVPFPCSGGVVFGAKREFFLPLSEPCDKEGSAVSPGGCPLGVSVSQSWELWWPCPLLVLLPHPTSACAWCGDAALLPAPVLWASRSSVWLLWFLSKPENRACMRCFFFVFIFTFLLLDEDFLGSRAPCFPRNGLLSLPHLPKRRRSRCCLLRSLAWAFGHALLA